MWSRLRNEASPRRAFTLVELLVVIAIIGVLIALLLPAVQAAREAARRSQCTNQLKQLGLALHNFHDVNRKLPAGSPYNYDGLPQVGHNWFSATLPFMEETAIFSKIDTTLTLAAQTVIDLKNTPIPAMICPSDPAGSSPILTGSRGEGPDPGFGMWYPASFGPTKPDFCNFCSDLAVCCTHENFGTNTHGVGSGMFVRYPKGFRFADVTDGLSKTIMAGETLPRDCQFMGAWANNFPLSGTTFPINYKNGVDEGYHYSCGYKSRHPGGANFLLGDASVHFVAQSIDYIVYNKVGSRAGGEAVTLP